VTFGGWNIFSIALLLALPNLTDRTYPARMPAAGSSSSPLPSTHPLVAELTSLRQQLAQYQKSGHQSAIQLQGARLELNFAKEESAVLRETNDTLRSEINVLRYAEDRRPKQLKK
jgi:hypothetical protein